MASIRLRDVTVEFPIYETSNRSFKKNLLWRGTGGILARDAANHVVVKALRNVDLHVEHGDRVGLVGANGAGKTTLLRLLAGIYAPIGGRVRVDGRVTALFDINVGIDPEATGNENIFLRGLLMGLSKQQVAYKLAEIGKFTELGPFLDMPVRTYSAGMTVRLAFAVATCVEPEILLMDECLLAGDAAFLQKAQCRMNSLIGRSSILIMATHNLEIIREWCNKAVLLDKGVVLKSGKIDVVLDAYRGIV